MASLRVCMLVLLSLFWSEVILNSVEAQKTTLLFAFGDSYADVGNTPKTGPSAGKNWIYPYGITWPKKNGPPGGRFSDGKTQTDWIKDLLRLPVYPPPYLYRKGADISSGINFAVGGAGISLADSPISLGAQVDNFELLLRSKPYSKAALANSLTLVSVMINDYITFKGNTSSDYFVFITRVITGIQANLQRLYDLGLRNVLVPNVFNADCIPFSTDVNGYTKCINEVFTYVQFHNEFLLGTVQSINAKNPGARFVILDHFSTFDRLIKEGSSHGFTLGLKPCCKGTSNTTSCGDVDPATQKWLYTVCKHRGRAIFWDGQHPTMWAWNYIINLYANEPGYLLLADAPTLKQWLQINDAVQEPIGSPLPLPDPTTAIGQAQLALEFLLNKPQYSEVIGLVQSFNLESILSGEPSQNVTVFLPTNSALSDPASRPVLDRVFDENKVNNVSLYHVAAGYFDLKAINTSKPASYKSLSGLSVPLAYPSSEVYVGTNLQAKVVEPNVYNVPGQIVIHGIDHVITPPGV